jgi:hypothetical protein
LQLQCMNRGRDASRQSFERALLSATSKGADSCTQFVIQPNPRYTVVFTLNSSTGVPEVHAPSKLHLFSFTNCCNVTYLCARQFVVRIRADGDRSIFACLGSQVRLRSLAHIEAASAD